MTNAKRKKSGAVKCGGPRISLNDLGKMPRHERVVAAILLAATSFPVNLDQIQPYVSQCYQEIRPDAWYVDCSRRPDGSMHSPPKDKPT
jgi:hypothetical protein